jgi:hypothetical protein
MEVDIPIANMSIARGKNTNPPFYDPPFQRPDHMGSKDQSCISKRVQMK